MLTTVISQSTLRLLAADERLDGYAGREYESRGSRAGGALYGSRGSRPDGVAYGSREGGPYGSRAGGGP